MSEQVTQLGPELWRVSDAEGNFVCVKPTREKAIEEFERRFKMKCDYERCPGFDYDTDDFDWGSYHEECRDMQTEDEQRYWASQFPARELVTADESVAYDRGDPKRFDLEQRTGL